VLEDAGAVAEPALGWEHLGFLAGGPVPGADTDEPQEAPTLDGLGRSFGDVLPLLAATQFDAMGAVLPGLLNDADTLIALSADSTQAGARTLRSQIRQVAGALMLHNWQFETAERAFALAMEDASDPLRAMSVSDERCWGLIRQGRLSETMDAAFGLAEQNEPRMTAAKEELAAYGKLMIRGSMAAVRDNRPDEAAEALRLARMAAAGGRSDFVLLSSPWHVFGPVTVSAFAAESALSPSPKCRSLLSASVNRYFPGGVVSVVKVPG
jgi:hypothetical protein